jgi:hypothetical protein
MTSQPFTFGRGYWHALREAAQAVEMPGPWRAGDHHYNAIVADPKYDKADDAQYYGGALVAESCQPKNARYIALLSPDVGLAIADLVLRAEDSPLTLEQARVIRSWAVDLECSNARVLELFDLTWGGGTDLGRGDELCAEARRLLGEAW